MKIHLYHLLMVLPIFICCNAKRYVVLEYPEGGISAKGYLNRDSLAVGIWTYYYDENRIEAVVSYNRKGEKNGFFDQYDINGNLLHSTHFKKDKLHGKQVIYYLTGEDSLIYYAKNDSVLFDTMRVMPKDSIP